AGRRVFLGVSRLASILGCDECGAILKCEACAIALAYSPAGRTLTCRLCGTARPLIDVCPACRGRRLAPFGWGAERVEHAVRRRFVSARIARFDPEAVRGARAEAQRNAALSADVVIGTRVTRRLAGPASLGLAVLPPPPAGAPRLTVYPSPPDRRNRARRIVVKGHADLPRVLAAALDGAEAIGAARSRGIMDVEVDPVEWPS